MANIGLALAQALRGALEGASLGFNIKEQIKRRERDEKRAEDEDEEREQNQRFRQIALAVGSNPGGVFLSDQAPQLGVDPLTGATDPNAPQGFQVPDDDVSELIPGVFQRKSLSREGLLDTADRRRTDRERGNIRERAEADRARDAAKREAEEEEDRKRQERGRALASSLGLDPDQFLSLSESDQSEIIQRRLDPSFRPVRGSRAGGKTPEEKAIEKEDRRRRLLIAREDSQVRGTERQLTRIDREIANEFGDPPPNLVARADSLTGVIDQSRARGDSLANALGDPPPELVPPKPSDSSGSARTFGRRPIASIDELDPLARRVYETQIREAEQKAAEALRRGHSKQVVDGALAQDKAAINQSFGLPF